MQEDPLSLLSDQENIQAQTPSSWLNDDLFPGFKELQSLLWTSSISRGEMALELGLEQGPMDIQFVKMGDVVEDLVFSHQQFQAVDHLRFGSVEAVVKGPG